MVETSCSLELFVGAVFDDPSLIDEKDSICTPNT